MQLSLSLPVVVSKEAYNYGVRASGETHGVVLTKPHVVELILDLCGYSENSDIFDLRLLEPSCGHGAFLIPAVRRLIGAARRADVSFAELTQCITAFDIDETHVDLTRQALGRELQRLGVSADVAETLVNAWVRCEDFLLAAISSDFDVIVGNPPYIRIEQLSPVLHAEYRRRFTTLYDRADLYVAFIECGLSLLSERGILSFICANRWILNKYGAPLRSMVAKNFGVQAYVDLQNTSPFESDVIAYPSIFVFSRKKPAVDPVVTMNTARETECRSVSIAIADDSIKTPDVNITRYSDWFSGDAPWVLSAPEHLSILRLLEARFREIEATARVGIGVATGCDQIYVVNQDTDIEPDRLVPLGMREDIRAGKIENAGRFVINTFVVDGGVVELGSFPRLQKYLMDRGAEVKKRHVARKNPRAWFRTIDRVYPDMVSRPKLLIPDIAGSNEVAFDEGLYHPHHNHYLVVSDIWDLEILGGLLSSRVALFFVWSYAVKMRGGYLRFQAQYLRRIRLPEPTDIGKSLGNEIKQAFRKRDFQRLDDLALKAYLLSEMPFFDFVDTRK